MQCPYCEGGTKTSLECITCDGGGNLSNVDYWIEIWKPWLRNNFAEGDHEPHWVNIIARSRGWAPLVIGEKMNVTMSDGGKYEIKRLS